MARGMSRSGTILGVQNGGIAPQNGETVPRTTQNGEMARAATPINECLIPHQIPLPLLRVQILLLPRADLLLRSRQTFGLKQIK